MCINESYKEHFWDNSGNVNVDYILDNRELLNFFLI